MTPIEQYNNELKHYGVLGMKWGVRRNAARTYANAVRKREKLIDRATNAKLKGAKLTNKSTGVTSVIKNRIPVVKQLNSITRMRGSSMSLKGAKLEKKARKLEKAIDKVFKDYTIDKIPNGNIHAGKNAIYRMLYGNDSYNVTKRN